MNVLMYYRYSPAGFGRYVESAFRREGHHVAFIGHSACWSQPGYEPAVDIALLAQESGQPWDLLVCTDDSWLPSLPVALEQLPFPTALYSADFQTRPATFRPLVPLFDYLFLTNHDIVAEVARVHPQTCWCPPGVDTDIHFPIPNAPKLYEVGIVGSASPSYPDRVRRLQEIARRYKTNDFFCAYPREQIREIYSRSKIVVNLTPRGISTFQFRILEAMACGTLVITDPGDSGVERLFRHGEHLVICPSEKDLIPTIDYYLAHDEERIRIAQAGHKLVVSQHRYRDRVRQIVATIESSGRALSAPARRLPPGRLALCYAAAYAQRGVVDPIFQLARKQKSPAARLRILLFMLRAVLRQLGLWGWIRRLRLALTGRGN